MQVRVGSVQDMGALDDGFSWRKYGQKDTIGSTYPRSEGTLTSSAPNISNLFAAPDRD